MRLNEVTIRFHKVYIHFCKTAIRFHEMTIHFCKMAIRFNESYIRFHKSYIRHSETDIRFVVVEERFCGEVGFLMGKRGIRDNFWLHPQNFVYK